ncbi:MAG: YceI family protein [Caldilineaceae bacterium]
MRLFSRTFLTAVLLIFVVLAAACSSSELAASVETPTVAAVAQPTDTPAPPAGPTAVPATEATPVPAAEAPTEAPAEAPAPVEPSVAVTFAIDPAQSEARFVLDEELLGSPKTVVGVNSGVTGQVTVDAGNPASVVIGPIVIDAAGFVTDSDRRNGAITRFILQSGSYPTITFTPTAVEGVPAAVAVGDVLNLQVTGDLTIREITRAETFAVTVTVVSESELHMSGATEILRDNYQVTIPSVPSVANVTNEVQLQFDFVATAQ